MIKQNNSIACFSILVSSICIFFISCGPKKYFMDLSDASDIDRCFDKTVERVIAFDNFDSTEFVTKFQYLSKLSGDCAVTPRNLISLEPVSAEHRIKYHYLVALSLYFNSGSEDFHQFDKLMRKVDRLAQGDVQISPDPFQGVVDQISKRDNNCSKRSFVDDYHPEDGLCYSDKENSYVPVQLNNLFIVYDQSRKVLEIDSPVTMDIKHANETIRLGRKQMWENEMKKWGFQKSPDS